MARRGFIDHKKGAVYFWSPKCACTTLFRALCNTYGNDQRYYHRASKPWDECRKIIDAEGYRSSAIVRNPYERTISCYFNKFIWRQGQALMNVSDLEGFSKNLHGEMQSLFAVESQDNIMTFERFLATIENLMAKRVDPNKNTINPHWDTQVPPAAVDFDFDFVIHMESFADEFDNFCAEFGLKSDRKVYNGTPYDQSSQEYFGDRPVAKVIDYPFAMDNFRSEKTDSLIRDLYQIDFSKFGYTA